MHPFFDVFELSAGDVIAVGIPKSDHQGASDSGVEARDLFDVAKAGLVDLHKAFIQHFLNGIEWQADGKVILKGTGSFDMKI